MKLEIGFSKQTSNIIDDINRGRLRSLKCCHEISRQDVGHSRLQVVANT
jgi:hypothetical protein